MKLSITAHCKFDIEVPTIEEIEKDPDGIPKPYDAEEWQKQLIDDAVHNRCGYDETEVYFVDDNY